MRRGGCQGHPTGERQDNIMDTQKLSFERCSMSGAHPVTVAP